MQKIEHMLIYWASSVCYPALPFSRIVIILEYCAKGEATFDKPQLITIELRNSIEFNGGKWKTK